MGWLWSSSVPGQGPSSRKKVSGCGVQIQYFLDRREKGAGARRNVTRPALAFASLDWRVARTFPILKLRLTGKPTNISCAEIGMYITLHRSGCRAIFVRTGTPLTRIPPEIFRWLGPIQCSDEAELDEDTPLLGLRPAAIVYDILTRGYCVVDTPESVSSDNVAQLSRTSIKT